MMHGQLLMFYSVSD